VTAPFIDGAPTGVEAYRQLDYLLLSTSLAAATTARPTTERRGLTTNAMKFTDKRLKGVTPKIAPSDHGPVAIDLEA